MAMIDNTLNERLAAGQLALGPGLRQARTVDIGCILAACGLDFAFIDTDIYDRPTMETYVNVGARFILCGSDVTFLMEGAQARSKFNRGVTGGR
jgi:2-keto-3-deoxy-L-rhamnonate aldolase RhmA